MKRIIIMTLMLAYILSIGAVPAKKEWRIYSQPDGTQVELMLVGDEHFNCYLTHDNVPVVEDNGAYCYAQTDGQAISSSGVLAHEVGERPTADYRHLTTWDDILQARAWTMKKAAQQQETRTPSKDRTAVFEGSQKGLIILANFSDKQFYDYDEADHGETTQSRYYRMANEVGYTNDYGAIGSIHDYFLDQSDGKFDLSFDVVGPINLKKKTTYYGQGNDLYAPLMIVESCLAADSLVDFNTYDWDGDGIVEEVFVVYAGYGAATGGGANTIWPHKSSLEMATINSPFLNLPHPLCLDGVVIDVYACSNELYSSKGTTEMGIGTFCHEFSHCLGLPDFYDTGAGTNYGTGEWDILCNGPYNGPMGLGWVPAGYTAYERWFAGWLEPTVLERDSIISDLEPINEEGGAYLIYNDNHKDEYYILENRNQTRWDTYVPSSGLLIYHVDYDAKQWAGNTVNAKDSYDDHERMAVFRAGLYPSFAYPSEDNDSLTDFSEPAAMLYHENVDGTQLMHKPITNITRDTANGSISFRFENKNMIDQLKEMESKTRKDLYSVYRLDGKIVAESITPAEVTQLPTGTYLVRHKDRRARKTVVR